MPRYKLTIEYDGTPYSGWQKHPDFQTVQGTLEAALASFMAQPVEAFCAGRTDAGVHARGQVVHVDLPQARKPFTICEGLNALLLPHPISVLTAEEVAPEFHARFDAKKRHYLYRIVNRSSRLALDATRAWYIFRPLDIEKMNEAAQLLLGHHDFTSFRDAKCQSKTAMKTLDELRIVRREKNPEQVMIYCSAKSFLHHQVRNMVGSLMMVGTGKWAVDDMKRALEARDRQAAGVMAPAHGLYLMKVEY